MSLEPEHKKRLRGIGHNLNPVVTIAGNGLSETVCAEIDRALRDHELIKVKLALPDRDQRRELGREICQRAAAELVQEIGRIILIYRSNPTANPRLSNIRRAAATGG